MAVILRSVWVDEVTWGERRSEQIVKTPLGTEVVVETIETQCLIPHPTPCCRCGITEEEWDQDIVEDGRLPFDHYRAGACWVTGGDLGDEWMCADCEDEELGLDDD